MKLHHIARSVLLPFALEEVFKLVEDIESYPEFLPWCRAADVIERVENDVVAKLRVVTAGHHSEIVTRNELDPFTRIGLHLIRGPFASFDGEWKFVDLQIGCKATLNLSFEFEGALLRLVGPRAIDMAIDRVMSAFTQRARQTCTPCE